jgi:hypothetical protein
MDSIDSFDNRRDERETQLVGRPSLSIQNQMSLIREVFQPFIEDNIAPPAPVQFFTMLERKSSQGLVSLLLTYCQNLGLLSVKIDSHRHVRIEEHSRIGVQVIRQRQCNGVATRFYDLDIQVTFASNAGPKTTVKAIDTGDESQQSEVIAFVQRHQSDEAIRANDGLWN